MDATKACSETRTSAIPMRTRADNEEMKERSPIKVVCQRAAFERFEHAPQKVTSGFSAVRHLLQRTIPRRGLPPSSPSREALPAWGSCPRSPTMTTPPAASPLSPASAALTAEVAARRNKATKACLFAETTARQAAAVFPRVLESHGAFQALYPSPPSPSASTAAPDVSSSSSSSVSAASSTATTAALLPSERLERARELLRTAQTEVDSLQRLRKNAVDTLTTVTALAQGDPALRLVVEATEKSVWGAKRDAAWAAALLKQMVLPEGAEGAVAAATVTTAVPEDATP